MHVLTRCAATAAVVATAVALLPCSDAGAAPAPVPGPLPAPGSSSHAPSPAPSSSVDPEVAGPAARRVLREAVAARLRELPTSDEIRIAQILKNLDQGTL